MKYVIKYCIIAVVFLLGTSSVIKSQNRIGIKAGTNLSPMIIKAQDTKADIRNVRFGYHIGGVVEHKFSPNFAVLPELLLVYSEAGYSYNYGYDTENLPSVGAASSQGVLSFYELQLPVSARYTFSIGSMNPYVSGGPYFGAILGGTDAPNNSESVNLYDSDQLYNRFDMGLNVGVGLIIKKFTVGLTYQISFIDINSNTDASVRLSNAMFSVGYFF